ncbi:MAG: capsular biosynthesis protein [Flavobacteriaceae bacterium]|nr:capsular biosynthesis protein [Flavobacteriaceae bacterium]|tara:strand:+ start:59907 stop:60878 length:972 start_codon:yes stop_codon:yes gene_type:complete
MKPKTIRNTTILDTSIATSNVGDEIIMDAVNKELYELCKEDRFFRIPTHEKIYKSSLSFIRNSSLNFLGGSNILSSYMNRYKQWRIGLLQSFFIRHKIITLGVGWRAYQGKPNPYTVRLLKNLLSKKYLHSVRDSHTEEYLNKIGINNVVNTGCPTMWRLTEVHCNSIPTTKTSTVIFTLTDYNQHVEKDTALIRALKEAYHEVYFWVQGRRDDTYFYSFDPMLIEGIKIIPPNLASYDAFLATNECDYIGTRLHGGIRALQHKRRTIIIGIDNRASEKNKDFNINVLQRDNIDSLPSIINSDFETKIRIDLNKINYWKSQFE